MDPDVYPKEYIIERKMPGSGNSRVKLVSFKNAILLVMVLPGKTAKETRVRFADMIRAHLAGAPVQPAKRTMEMDVESYNLDMEARKAKIALMIAEANLKTAEADLKAADANLKAADADLKAAEARFKTAETHEKNLLTYVSICNNPVLDHASKALFKARMMQTICPKHSAGEDPSSEVRGD